MSRVTVSGPPQGTTEGGTGFRWLPPWILAYQRVDLSKDLAAGATVAVMLIPQGMAYAMLAGLPPVVGLYASILPLVGYALVGTSRQLAVGPVAMDSLLVAAGASLVATPGTPDFIYAATLIAGMAGVIQLLLGWARLGSLVTLLSRPVISGFTSGAAILIGLSQLKHLLGAPIPRGNTLPEVVSAAIPHAQAVHALTFGTGLTAIAALLLLKRIAPKLPGALIVTTLGTTASAAFDLKRYGLAVVGAVPSGLPSFSWPGLRFDLLERLWPTALMIALIGYLEAISVAKHFATKHRYGLNSNRELAGLGLANMAAFFTGGYPVTGGFSRSAVNEGAGARTQLAGLVTAGLLAIAVLWFTPLLTEMPKAVLSALVMVSVGGLIKMSEPLRLWRVRPVDAALLGLTFVATLTLGVGLGVLVGVGLSLAAFIRRSAQPHTAELGRLPGTNVFRNFKNFPNAEPIENVLILRMDASLYFANTDFFVTQVEQFLANAGRPISHVLIDASSINDLDCSAEAALEELAERLRAEDLDLYFANVKGPVLDVMARGGLLTALGDSHIFLNIDQATRALSPLDQQQ